MIKRRLSIIQLFEDLNTAAELHNLISQIDELIESLFKFKESMDDKFDRCVSINYKLQVMQWVRESGVDIQDRVSVQRELTLLKKELSSIPTLKITIAYEPKGFQMKQLNSWLAQNFNRKILLDISVDTDIIGGALIQAGGYYKDYSLRKALSEVSVSSIIATTLK
ncbi:F0F1 ATP synthase subunit delta [candidate division WWE3 bacterium]|nr:F0F1 ATP synthase subunit delta [candidate division WWE3 bacterium]